MKKVTSWSFPEINELDEDDIPLKEQAENDNIITEIQNDLLAREIEEENLKKQREEEYKKMRQEIDEMKNDYQNRISLVNNVLLKLQEPLGNVNDEMLNIIKEIIKKAVKNIIHQEINFRPNLLVEIIQELKDIIKNKNGKETILISEVDYNRLKQDHLSMKNYKISSDLHEGDIIIQSKYGEIRALLDERINCLMENNNV